MSAGLVVSAVAANAQGLASSEFGRGPYTVVSDVEGPYAGMPPQAYGPRYGGPMLLPPQEVYTVLREPQFQNSGLGVQRPRKTALPAIFWRLDAELCVAIPVPGLPCN